ncbi:MAG: outer membrane beta-barrel protein [Fidelibacterota bacterium]
MLKNSVFVLLFFLSSLFANEQSTKFGFFAGINASGVFGQYMTNEIFKAGPSLGIELVRPLQSNLYFRTGLQWTRKGFKTGKIKSEDYIDRKERYYFIADYLEIPFLLQFHGTVIDISGNWVAGLGAGLNIHNSAKTKIDKQSFREDVDIDMRIFDMLVIIGANKMLTQQLSLDFRGSAGLIPYNKNSDVLGKRHASLNLTFGYYF